MEDKRYTVAVISDTHGLLRPQAVSVLAGAELIVHAGDIDRPEILQALEAIAPVVAVRGNCDRGSRVGMLPAAETMDFGGLLFHILHDLSRLDLDPKAAGIHVVISGHTHVPAVSRKDEVLYLNPGSAGPRRFSLPITLARITVQGKELFPEIIQLA